MTCEVWGVSGLEMQSLCCCDPLCRSRQGLPTAGRVQAVGAWGHLALLPRPDGGRTPPPDVTRAPDPADFCPLPQTKASHCLLWPGDISRCWILQTLEKPPVVRVMQPVKGVTTPACRDACSVIDDAGLCVPFSLTCFLFAPL